MLKSFILAATSIACIFSISSIADAKVAKIHKSVDRGQSCENPVDSNSQYTQLAKNYPNLGNDLKAICQLINNHYSLKHRRLSTNWDTKDLQKLPAHGYSVVGNTEVKNMKLVEYSQNKLIDRSTRASADIEVNERRYAWENSSWKLVSTAASTYHFTFIKTNDRWEIAGGCLKMGVGHCADIEVSK
jgi:hypothetical protein